MAETVRAGFEIVRLPSLQLDSSIDTGRMIRSYRAFRLSSLKSDPDAFASTYLEESKEGDEFWQNRLANPKASHFIAVVPESDLMSSSNWLGMVVLLGPMAEDGMHKISANVSPWTASGQSQVRGGAAGNGSEHDIKKATLISFHLNGTYTIPSARRKGIGAALFQEALQHAESMCRELGGEKLECTLYVDADNGPAVRLYEDRGFVKVAEMMYKPKPTETGEREEKLAWKMVMQKSL